jgi:nickel/cobalt transporter (NicO) family protein
MGRPFSFDNGMRFGLVLPFVLLLAAPAAAHPLTDVRFDRTIAIRLGDEAVEISYTLEISPLGLHLDAARRLSTEDIAALDKSARGYAAAYAKRVAPEIAEKLHLTANGTRLVAEVKAIDVTYTDHAVCRFTLRALWPPGDVRRELTVNDETFADRPGVINLTLNSKAEARLKLIDVEDPPLRVRTQPLSKLSEEDAALTRRASAVAMLLAPISSAPSRPPTAPEPIPEPVVNADVPPPSNLFADLAQRGLPALFDSTYGIGVLLLAALLFGAAHAFTPGHGKTLVAAYLVGERGTVKHAVILALATTIAHTGSVIAVAAILWGVYGNNVPGTTQGTLQLIAGLLVIAVGLWLLLRRVTGQADHVHLFAGHHHHHDHEHGHSHDHDHSHDHHHHHGPPPESAKSTGGWLRIVLMGLGGGLVPCWDAVLLLVAASAMGRLGFAIPLLIAFSLGLGAVLVGLGIGVVYAYRAGRQRFKESRWFRLLPTVSAALLVGIGFWLCRQAVGMVAP